ncbi:MAG: nuclear transport factor 2 family protein [Leeuwenhoekiella sp.]
MKALFLYVFFFGIISLNAQSTIGPVETVKEFFKAFHEQDTAKMHKMTYKSVIMQSISVDSMGVTQLKNSDYKTFLSSIAAIPKDASFEERISEYNVQRDEAMAQVWAPYEFYYQGNLSHSGTNNFQLLKENGFWKIFYIVDTRLGN